MYRSAKLVIGVTLFMFLGSFVAYPKDLSPDLCRTVEQGDVTAVKALLAQGSDVNAKDNNDVTALMHAVQKGNIKIVEILLAKGADVNAKDNDGGTALMVAAGKVRPEVVQEHKAKSRYLVIEVLGKAYPEIIKVLLAKGADFNAKDNNGRTAMTHALLGGHDNIVGLLKKAGAKE